MRARKINGKLNIIGPTLMKYRKEKDLSLRDLADKLALLGITMYHSDIHSIEHQERTIKDFEIKAICRVLNITYEQLFENTEDID